MLRALISIPSLGYFQQIAVKSKRRSWSLTLPFLNPPCTLGWYSAVNQWNRTPQWYTLCGHTLSKIFSREIYKFIKRCVYQVFLLEERIII